MNLHLIEDEKFINLRMRNSLIVRLICLKSTIQKITSLYLVSKKENCKYLRIREEVRNTA